MLLHILGKINVVLCVGVALHPRQRVLGCMCACVCRKAAAMAIYREVEEAWERQQEEKEATRRTEAAKRKIEQEVLVRDRPKKTFEGYHASITNSLGRPFDLFVHLNERETKRYIDQRGKE